MIPLDDYDKWKPAMKENAQRYLSRDEIGEFETIPKERRDILLRDLLSKPIACFTAVNDVYFRSRWAEVLKMLHPETELTLLEIASGDADMIPQVMARTHPGSRYITANMNKRLSWSLLGKTKNLAIDLKIVEDDAAYIQNHLGVGVVDIIAFQHAVNDVMQAILCDKNGVDTVYSDWMETLPKMIEMLQREMTEETLEQHVKTPFLGLIKNLLNVLKPGGIIIANHYMFQLDLDWGYPMDLFENMIPMTRAWLKELSGCTELFFDGFDQNWWIFLKKVS
jgi:hypothetical protein